MTDAEKAYSVAEEMIAEALAKGRKRLDFDDPNTHALTVLPPQIADLTALRHLDCDKTQISDLSPLSGLTGLTDLRLNETAVSDLSPLSGLTGLTGLGLERTAVSDLSPLSGLTGLTVLVLSETAVSDLLPLSGLTGLTGLWLNGTAVSDLSPLSGLTGLKDLGLSGTAVSDLRPLLGVTSLVDGGARFGLRFEDCAATRLDARIAEISEIESSQDRVRALFEYLEDWVPPGAKPSVDTVLRGPILAEALTDIERDAEQFRASALTDEPAKSIDQRHSDLVANLGFICTRMGKAEVQNRLGKDVRENFRDYGEFVAQEPINGRILWFLSNGVRGALSDPYLTDAMDRFDRTQLTGFLSENDALIGEYYPDAMRGAQFDTDTDPAVLSAELPGQLASVTEMLEADDARGVFAPNVSTALEMLIRRAEGARRGYLTGATEEEREAAGKELQRVAVQSTAFSGRIKGRVTEWLQSIGKSPTATGVATLGSAAGGGVLLWQSAAWVVQKITPVFEAMWKMVGNLPLPF